MAGSCLMLYSRHLLSAYIAPVCAKFVSHRLDAFAETASAFGSFIACADFVIIKFIFFSNGNRGEVGHDHIRSCEYSHFSAFGMNGSQRCRSRQKDIGKDQADDGEKPQGFLQCTGCLAGKRCILMRNKRSDSTHVRRKFFN